MSYASHAPASAGGPVPLGEAPRDVVRTAGDWIAVRLADDGFHWSPGKRLFHRQLDGRVHEIGLHRATTTGAVPGSRCRARSAYVIRRSGRGAEPTRAVSPRTATRSVGPASAKWSEP
jgi:hypothetical protein